MGPITSLYLDVDGRRLVRPLDVEQELDRVLRTARSKANGHQSVHEDLRRIADFVHQGIDRRGMRGLAFFAGSADDVWEVVELPVPVRSRVVVNHAPAVSQLESIVRDHESTGVLLADRQRARLFVFELGRLVEHSELIDELPRDYDVRGLRERGTPESHVEELAHQHLRHAARAAFELWQQHEFQRLCLGGPEAVLSDLETALHPYLKERLSGRLKVGVGASEAEVRDAAADAHVAVERARQAALVDRLKAGAATSGRAVLGLADTLAALNDKRVERLVVSKGFSAEGWCCPESGALAAVGPTNPANGVTMERVADVVEDAIEVALTQKVPVTMCIGNADLDVAGQIGALLRY